ncbi:MAG: glucosamine-6-phosphate deaminase [Bacteroidales bacterium]|nr:glucosamine-6-phosphate deaminase [Bacteroidales bacterium]
MLIKDFKVDKLSVRIFDSRESMGAAAASEAAACLRDILSKKEEVNVVFAAAPSQNEFLAALSKAEGIDWGKVSALHMDEYVGLPEDAPQGFGNFLRRAIFDKVPFKEVFHIGSQLPKEEAVARYDKILSERHIDIVFMGIGENGHIAFNDPHVADFDDPLRIKEVDLDLKCRTQQVHDGCFTTLEEVPEYALTLTCPVLFGADHLFCVVPAETKAEAARAMLRGPITETCPASILRRHEDATLYLDRDSGRFVLD